VNPLISGAIAAAGSIIVTTKTSIQAAKWLKHRWEHLKAKRDNIEHLFGFIKDADINIGGKNPWIEWKIPPDDKESLRLFKSWMKNYFRGGRQIEYLDSPFPYPDPNKDLCSISGPVNHPLTRYGMGYDPKGESWIPVLPFYYPLKEAEASGAIIRRRYKRQEWRNPNWYIADRNGKLFRRPEVDKDGILRKDYFMLIITSNIFTHKAWCSGKKHMMVACAHGLAQLAMKDIFNDDKILEWLKEVSVKTGYYQAIIEVPGVRDKRGEYVPGKLTPLVAEPLDPDDFRKLSKKRGWIK
jgi:hypothetical protein